jgi:hypothetical protein
MFLFYVSSASRNFGDVKAAAVERHHRELKMRACGFEGLAGLGRNISRLARKPRLVAGALSYQRRSFLTRPLQTGRKTYDARFRRSRQLIGILRGEQAVFFL